MGAGLDGESPRPGPNCGANRHPWGTGSLGPNSWVAKPPRAAGRLGAFSVAQALGPPLGLKSLSRGIGPFAVTVGPILKQTILAQEALAQAISDAAGSDQVFGLAVLIETAG